MTSRPTVLKELLIKKHWQKYETFCAEYDRVATEIDPRLRTTQPSRAQYYRWTAGQLKGGLPYPDACRVLESMFPGYTAHALFQAPDSSLANASVNEPDWDPRANETRELAELVRDGFSSDSDTRRAAWGEAAANIAALRPPAAAGDMPLPVSKLGAPALNDGGLQHVIARRLVMLQQRERISQDELRRLGALAGQLVDLDVRVEIDIDESGWSTITTRQHLLNLTDGPVGRVVRDMWFEHTDGSPGIQPLASDDGGRQLTIRPVADVPSMTKFACQLSPPVQPGETGVIAYECKGGQFVSDHYWRQAFHRYTRRFTLTLRHRAVRPLLHCDATEELPSGAVVSSANDLVWDYEGDDVVITHTRDYLHPGQAVTLRWEVTH